MKTIYLIGSICGIILMSVFCYQHRPYIERTAEVIEINNCYGYYNFLYRCTRSDFEKLYNFCGEEMIVTSTIYISPNEKAKQYNIKCIGSDCGKKYEKQVISTYIPCYKLKLKFR